MSKFEDANLRAMAATMEPMSTFSPMQVRLAPQVLLGALCLRILDFSTPKKHLSTANMLELLWISFSCRIGMLHLDCIWVFGVQVLLVGIYNLDLLRQRRTSDLTILRQSARGSFAVCGDCRATHAAGAVPSRHSIRRHSHAVKR